MRRPAPERLVAVIAAALTLAPLLAAAGKPGGKMAMATDKEWRAAEQAAVAHARGKWQGEPTQVVRHARVPFLVDVDFATGGETVLVQGGKVVEARGLTALGEALHAIGLPAQAGSDHAPHAEDLTRLVILFEALPPVQGIAPTLFHADPHLAHTKLLPSLTRNGEVAEYRLRYLLRGASTADLPPTGAPSDLPGRGGPPIPALVTVSEWTLTIPAGSKPPTWSELRYRWDTKKQRRAD